MATPLYSSKLSGSKFKNWIKAGLGVLYTKEGIEPLVYDEIEQFQQNCLSDICNNNGLDAGTTCSSCCTENVIVCPTDRICNVGRGKCKFHRNSATQYLPSGCPNKICHNFKNEIQNAHRYYGPSYKNTDASQWCSNAWEVAKCFMPPDGYKDVRSAAETNFNGILSVIINYKALQSKVHDDLSRRNNIFDKAREVGKAVIHSSYLGMEDEDLQQYFSILQNLLSDPGYLATNSTSQNAKKKLSQLQNDTLVIGIEDIHKVLDDVAKAFEDELRTEKDEHTKKAEKQKLELIKITNKSVSAFERQEKLSMFELDEVLQSAVVETEVHTKEPVIEDHSTQKSHQHEAKKSTDKNPESHAEDASIQDEEVTESANDKELGTSKTNIDKAWGKLVDYMIPDPILDSSVFEFREKRDIMDEKNTSEKNRGILTKFRCKGAVGYKSLKTCLVNTKQTLLVKLLECIEKGEDTSLLEKQLQEYSQTMTTLDNERYMRHIWLLGEGGLLVLGGIVTREAAGSGQTLEYILATKRDKFKHLLREQFLKLFPSTSTINADVNSWDMSLLCVVVETLFMDRQGFPPADKISIIALKTYKDNIQGHPTSMTMSATDYDSSRNLVEPALLQLASGISPDTETKIRDIIEKTKSAIIDIQLASRLTKEFHESKISDISIKLNEIDARVKKIQELQIHVFKRSTENELKTIIEGKCDHKEKEKKAMDVLFDFVKMIQNQNDFTEQEIKHNIEQRIQWYGDICLQLIDDLLLWFSDMCNIPNATPGAAQLGSIRIPIKCYAMEGVLKLMEYIDSATCKERLSNISNSLSKVIGFPLSLSWIVEPASLQNVMITLSKKLETSDLSSVSEKIVLPFQSKSLNGLTNIWTVFEGDKVNSHLARASKTLSKIVGADISLTTSVVKEQFTKAVYKMNEDDDSHLLEIKKNPQEDLHDCENDDDSHSFGSEMERPEGLLGDDSFERLRGNEKIKKREKGSAFDDESHPFEIRTDRMIDLLDDEKTKQREQGCEYDDDSHLLEIKKNPQEDLHDYEHIKKREKVSEHDDDSHSFGSEMERPEGLLGDDSLERLRGNEKIKKKEKGSAFDKHPRSQAEQDYEERKTQTPKAVDEPPNLFQRIYGWFTYPKRKEDLRENLIGLYREEYHTLPLSPLLEENDTPLLEFYVIPDIESVEIQRSRGGGKEARSKVTSLHDVFYKENEPCRKIYLAADAGFGKTAFSKRLVLTWCQAKNCIPNEDKHFKKEDISTMSNFDFVFLLSLRDCSEEGDIDEMIKKQLINDLAHTISTSDFENILSKERCLIILDGLDEYTHAKSDIPHRKTRRRCTILTTTRPWKLGVSKIHLREIERKLELVGLSKTSARRLKRSVISLLWGETDIKKHIQEFDRAVSERGISDLETIPLLLVYLLCLWCDETDLGKSRTELYCQIANLLLKRTFEKYPDMKQSCEQPKSDIPQCISRNEHCRKHYNLLNALGRLAFETLFDETKDQNLVFDMAVAEKCLSDKDLLQLSRHSGIITHDKDQTKINKQMQKTSFSHATVQEFFAALYISVSWDQEEVQTKVLSFCHCVARILAMSKVFVFISGINAIVFSSMSKDLMKVISEDKITREYRSTTDEDCEPLKDIQDMYISCMKENTSDMELKLFCQDFFFSEDCEEEKYFTYLARLAVHNKKNMASININTGYRGRSLREIIDCCELHELFQINKIYYQGIGENAQLRVLLDKSPKCVTVISVISPLSPGSWSREMLETLQNNSLLQAIYIEEFEMSHDVLNDFLNYIINRKTMTEIILWDLGCAEHERSCTFSLDFSQHSDLRMLELGPIPEVSQLKVNSQVKHVWLVSINLGERSLPPEMANIESVYLGHVNMSASTLRDLVKVVEKLSHKVTVTIDEWCKIEPETEFEHVKQDIHSSQNFRVTKDDSWEFVFETKDES